MNEEEKMPLKPGVCQPWSERRKKYPVIQGDEQIVQNVWEEIDQLAYLYVWFCMISS